MDDFIDKAQAATEQGKKLKFPRYGKNLRYDAFGIYSFNTMIAELDVVSRSIRSLGWFSVTTAKHYNYAVKYLEQKHDFMEVVWLRSSM